MPLIKAILTPNGVPVSFHKIKSANYDLDSGVVAVTVSSWATQEVYQSGQGLAWMWHIDAAPVVLQDLEGSVAQIVPFDNASIVPESYIDIDSLKVRKWADIKGQRDATINGGFTWDGSTFDSDPISQNRITGGTVLALMAAMNQQEFSKTWVLADNTTRVLSGTDMQMVGVTLGEFVQGLIDQGNVLRDQIEAATTAEELEAIQWPNT
jgi:hypothetical protein